MAGQRKLLKNSRAASADGHSVAKVGARILDLTCGYEAYMWHETATGLNLDTALYASKKVSEGDIPYLVRIKREIAKATSRDHPKIDVLMDIYLQWYRINQNIFRFIYDKSALGGDHGGDGRVIGFTSIIPLTDEGFQRYRSGQLSEWRFGERSADTGKTAIEPSGSGPHKILCIQSINLLPAYWYTPKKRQCEPLESLLATLVSHLSLLNPVPHQIPPRLIADGGSQGLHILESHGFLKILEPEQAIDGLPMFELDLARPFELPNEKGRFVCGELEFLMEILGSAQLIREHLVRNLGEVPLAFNLWSSDEVAVGKPTWELYLIHDRKHARQTAKLTELKTKLYAPVRLRASTLQKFQLMLANNQLRQRLYGRRMTIVACADRKLAKQVSTIVKAGQGDGGMPGEDLRAQLMNEKLPEDVRNDPFARASLLHRYSEGQAKPFKRLSIVCVLHFLLDLIPFFEALVRLGADEDKIVFFHKSYPYPQRLAVGNYLSDRGAHVYPLSQLDAWLDEQEKKKNAQDIIFIEDGGYITPKLLCDLPNLRKRTRLTVEQTTKGKRKIEHTLKELLESTKVEFPILSVASCKLKGAFEPRFIADSFVQNLRGLLPDILIPGSYVGLIGFGSIGKAVAHQLKNAGAIITVYDEKPENRVEAANGGYPTVTTKHDVLKNRRWIVGCTGEEVIGEHEFYELSDSTYLISCSSEKYEFDVEDLEEISKGQDYVYSGKVVGRKYELRGANNRRIYLVADGYPLNFWGITSMPEPLGDFIMTVLLLAARYGLDEKHTGRIDAEAVDRILEVQEIAKRFEDRHHQR